MAPTQIDAAIDRLYQAPLNQFTAARNQLARQAGAAEAAARVKALEKPTVPAWGVNQLYWQDRPIFDAVIEAGSRLRSATKGGKRAEIRGATQAQRRAVDVAVQRTMAILSAAGQRPSAATRQGVAETLEALSVSGGRGMTPGRLTTGLTPPGFEVLAGLGLKDRPERPLVQEAPRRAKPQRDLSAIRKSAAKRRAEVKRLETAAAHAAARYRSAQSRADAARQASERAQSAAADLESEVQRLHEQLERARAGLKHAEDELAAARVD